jgi:molecular chaperone GrpE
MKNNHTSNEEEIEKQQLEDNAVENELKINPEEENSASTEETTDKKIEELENQLKEQNEKYLRLYSEFDNFRRRTAKERIELVGSAGADIISTLLPIIDDFERAIKSSESTSDIAALKEGVNLIYNKFLNTLTKKGLEPMKAAGESFDPEFHEAITNIPAPNQEMVGKVVDEVEKGYLLNGKVIRYAKVVVGN